MWFFLMRGVDKNARCGTNQKLNATFTSPLHTFGLTLPSFTQYFLNVRNFCQHKISREMCGMWRPLFICTTTYPSNNSEFLCTEKKHMTILETWDPPVHFDDNFLIFYHAITASISSFVRREHPFFLHLISHFFFNAYMSFSLPFFFLSKFVPFIRLKNLFW